jgi:hypothetical protein
VGGALAPAGSPARGTAPVAVPAPPVAKAAIDPGAASRMARMASMRAAAIPKPVVVADPVAAAAAAVIKDDDGGDSD